MNIQQAGADIEYLEQKRRQLTQLRTELLAAAQAAQLDKSALEAEPGMAAHEFEEEAQRLDLLEQHTDLAQRNRGRLAQVQRALEKIDEGTYGLSDVSGQRIRADRLEVKPEALTTLAEQEEAERRVKPP